MFRENVLDLSNDIVMAEACLINNHLLSRKTMGKELKMSVCEISNIREFKKYRVMALGSLTCMVPSGRNHCKND